MPAMQIRAEPIRPRPKRDVAVGAPKADPGQLIAVKNDVCPSLKIDVRQGIA
jgi:hypothetical protein